MCTIDADGAVPEGSEGRRVALRACEDVDVLQKDALIDICSHSADTYRRVLALKAFQLRQPTGTKSDLKGTQRKLGGVLASPFQPGAKP